MKTNTVASVPSRTSSFSLAALLFLMSCAAVLFTILLSALQARGERRIGGMELAVAAGGVGAFGAFLGGLIGSFHYRRVRGLGWGLLTGLLTGICIGPVVLSDQYGRIVAACLGGSLLLLTLAVFYRLQDW